MPWLVHSVPRAAVEAAKAAGWIDDPDFNRNPERQTVVVLRAVTPQELPSQAALYDAFERLKRQVGTSRGAATRATGACGPMDDGAPETRDANAVRSELGGP